MHCSWLHAEKGKNLLARLVKEIKGILLGLLQAKNNLDLILRNWDDQSLSSLVAWFCICLLQDSSKWILIGKFSSLVHFLWSIMAHIWMGIFCASENILCIYNYKLMHKREERKRI